MKKFASLAAVAAIALALTACTSAPAETPKTPAAEKPAVVEEGPELSAWSQLVFDADLQVGDCLNTDYETTLEVVDCGVAHGLEVYSVVEFDSGSYESDSELISDGYMSPMDPETYIGGYFPTETVNGEERSTYGINTISFWDNQDLWGAGYTKAAYVIRSDQGENQVGSVKGILG